MSAPVAKAEPASKSAPSALAETAVVQLVIDAIDALVVVADRHGCLWLWNQRCDETSGVPLSDMAGKSLWSVMRLRPSARLAAQQAFARLLSGEERSVALQAQWLRKDGRKARVSWTARLVACSAGRCVIATGRETTRGRQVARDIAETESRFETLLEVLPDPVVVHQNGRLVFVNRAAIEMYGAGSAEEMCGPPVIERVAPEDRALVLDRMNRMLTQGETVPMVQERHLKLDGTAFDVEVVAAPVTFDGKPAVEVLAHDVTARNQTTSALRASEARVRAVFDQSSLGMVLIDRNGLTLESNAAFHRLLDYDREEMRQLRIYDYTHPDDRAATESVFADLFAARSEGYELEKRYLARDGREIWVRVHVSAVRDGAGPPELAVATVEDITARKVLEEQLGQASKMEALGRLAGGVAHDFNNLLTVVNGYADLLALSLDGDERAADAIEIRRAGARAAELTSQLLAFGRRTKRDLEPVDLNGQIDTMAPMLRRLLGEDIEFRIFLDRKLGAVQADPSQLDQVIMNLVVNGRDAMPSGGSLTVTTRGLAPRNGDRSGRPWARLEIADSGFGIEPEVLEHIFEPFFTTKSQGKGTGLGLATVYGIVQQMGGRVWGESTVGVGSRFIVELPLSELASPLTDRASAEPRPSGRGSETVLLVEDEPAVRDFCRRALDAEGYRVHVAGPHEALDMAEQLGSALDLVVTDVVMPDLDGPTIAAALRSRNRDLKVLFMSGYPRDREEELTGAVAQGAVLAKPFKANELCEAVRRVIDRPI